MDAAEERARELLRAVVAPREYEAYERLGFMSVPGANPRYAYLLYPYRPLVAYDTHTGLPLCEYCVAFFDDSQRLPPADDVLAKWMALNGSERRLIAEANHDPAGHQVDPAHVRRDVARFESLLNAT
jgi:hypothetical protein